MNLQHLIMSPRAWRVTFLVLTLGTMMVAYTYYRNVGAYSGYVLPDKGDVTSTISVYERSNNMSPDVHAARMHIYNKHGSRNQATITPYIEPAFKDQPISSKEYKPTTAQNSADDIALKDDEIKKDIAEVKPFDTKRNTLPMKHETPEQTTSSPEADDRSGYDTDNEGNVTANASVTIKDPLKPFVNSQGVQVDEQTLQDADDQIGVEHEKKQEQFVGKNALTNRKDSQENVDSMKFTPARDIHTEKDKKNKMYTLKIRRPDANTSIAIDNDATDTGSPRLVIKADEKNRDTTHATENNVRSTEMSALGFIKSNVKEVADEAYQVYMKAKRYKGRIGDKPDHFVDKVTKVLSVQEREPLKPDAFYVEQNLEQLRLEPTANQPSFVLLVTYARSGSTWLGGITSKADQSFYIYEPLFRIVVEGYFKKGAVCYNNNTCRAPRSLEETHDFALTSLQRLFTCQFTKLHPKIKNNFGKHIETPAAKTIIASCGENVGHGNIYLNDDCLQKLEKMCLKTKYRIFKTIRLSMDLVEMLLDLLPNLKIIHLIRDPRGITNSRNHGSFKMSRAIITHSKDMCTRMREDVLLNWKLKQSYPDRLSIIFYEALAERPYEGAEFIYKFIGIEITSSVIQWVFESTHAHNTGNKTGYFSTKRDDAVSIAYHWREQLSFVKVRTIDTICDETYKLLGFIPFKNLSNLQSPKVMSRKHIKDFDGFI